MTFLSEGITAHGQADLWARWGAVRIVWKAEIEQRNRRRPKPAPQDEPGRKVLMDYLRRMDYNGYIGIGADRFEKEAFHA